MSSASKNKLKKAGNSKTQSKLLEHNFGQQTEGSDNKRKRKRSKKSKENLTSPEQPNKKHQGEEKEAEQESKSGPNLEPKPDEPIQTSPKMDPKEESQSLLKELSEDQLRLYMAITKAIRITSQEDMNALLSPITRDVNILLNLKDTMERQTTEIQNIKVENQELKQRCVRMENEHDQLKRRITALEDMKLEGNVIYQGVQESQWESDPDLINKIYGHMSATVKDEITQEEKLTKVKKFKIIEATRLGTKSENRTRPVRVRYENANTVNILLNNKKNLPEGIYVDKEYSLETSKNRRILRPYFNAAKKSSEYFRKCRMEGDVLILKGIKYTVNNLNELPEDLNGFHASSRNNDDIFAFFGEANPFSNFHTSKFTLNGVEYNNSEQFIQSEKAKYFKDESTARRILQASSGLECKKLSREIKNYRHEEWKNIAADLSEPGIAAKFDQNPTLKALLLSTGDKLVVEASRDPVWGTGIPLNNREVLTRSKWVGNGILSDILMNIKLKAVEEPHGTAMDTETSTDNRQDPSRTTPT